MVITRPPLRLPMISLFAGTLSLIWRSGQAVPISPATGEAALYFHCAAAALGLVLVAVVWLIGTLLVAPNYEVARPSATHLTTLSASPPF